MKVRLTSSETIKLSASRTTHDPRQRSEGDER